MDIAMQIIFGSYVGWMLYKPFSNKLLDISLGIIGAMSASAVMKVMGMPGVSGYNLYSFLVALVGAVAVICIGRALANRNFLGQFSNN